MQIVLKLIYHVQLHDIYIYIYINSRNSCLEIQVLKDTITIIKELKLVKHVSIGLIYNEAGESDEEEKRINNERRKISKLKHKMSAIMHFPSMRNLELY